MQSLPQLNNNEIDNTQVMLLINSIPIFAGMDVVEQRVVAQKSYVERYGPDKIVIEEGDIGDRLYAIVKGEVIVSKWDQSHGWVQINRLGAGDFFGEIAILRRIPRTARITTSTACELLVLKDIDFIKIFQNFTQKTRDNITSVVEKRLQELSSTNFR